MVGNSYPWYILKYSASHLSLCVFWVWLSLFVFFLQGVFRLRMCIQSVRMQVRCTQAGVNPARIAVFTDGMFDHAAQ